MATCPLTSPRNELTAPDFPSNLVDLLDNQADGPTTDSSTLWIPFLVVATDARSH